MGTRVRSSIVLLAFVVCVCSASARVIGAQAPARQPSVTTDVVYGQKEDGLALTLDVHRPAHPNGAGLISIVSGGWQSSVELARIFTQAYPPLSEKGFTIFAVRHGSWPTYPLSSIVADMRRSVRFVRQHAKEYGVDPSRIGRMWMCASLFSCCLCFYRRRNSEKDADSSKASTVTRSRTRRFRRQRANRTHGNHELWTCGFLAR